MGERSGKKRWKMTGSTADPIPCFSFDSGRIEMGGRIQSESYLHPIPGTTFKTLYKISNWIFEYGEKQSGCIVRRRRFSLDSGWDSLTGFSELQIKVIVMCAVNNQPARSVHVITSLMCFNLIINGHRLMVEAADNWRGWVRFSVWFDFFIRFHSYFSLSILSLSLS